ncbi:MAG TPA: CPBP family intramembrane glutamic endopeptidase [Gemmatimonadaceae bacterium]
MALTAVFTSWERLRLKDVGAAIGKRSALRLATGFVLGLLLVSLHMSIEAIAADVRWVRSEGVGFLDLLTSLIIYLLLSCREELAFRGYPLRRLNALFGLWTSQFIVAFVFALEHVAGGSTWVQALFGAGVGSLLFGMASIATKGLAVPIGLHAAWNFGDWMHGGKGSGGLWHPLEAEAVRDRAELAGMIGYVAVMVTATLAFWWFYRRLHEGVEAPGGERVATDRDR